MPGKLGKTTKQRMALLRGQASQLLWYGRIETTQARAKELRSYVEKLITKAVNTYDDVVEYEVVAKDKKGKEVKTTSVKDGPKKLAARRQIIAKTYDLQEITPPDHRKDVRSSGDQGIRREQEGVQGAHRAGAASPCGEALQRDRSQVRTAQGRARPGRRLYEDLSPRPAPRRRFRKGSHRARLSSQDKPSKRPVLLRVFFLYYRRPLEGAVSSRGVCR